MVKKNVPIIKNPRADVYAIDMGRIVGTQGETHIRLIVAPRTSKILTACLEPQ